MMDATNPSVVFTKFAGSPTKIDPSSVTCPPMNGIRWNLPVAISCDGSAGKSVPSTTGRKPQLDGLLLIAVTRADSGAARRQLMMDCDVFVGDRHPTDALTFAKQC